jgi:hypothetical protein
MLLALIAGVVLVRPADAEMQLVKTAPFEVPSSSGGFNTGIDLKTGDRLVVEAHGIVEACAVLCGKNGPDGNTRNADDRFPLHGGGVKEFGLIGKIGNASYFNVGSSYDEVYQGGPGRLFLRINDDKLDDNTGSFTGNIEVYRDATTPPPPPHLQCSDTIDNDGDGKIDFGTGANNDPGCTSATDNDETDNPITDTMPPMIAPIAPAPSSSTHNRTPLISATVKDDTTDLDGTTIKLFVDGIEKTASYDRASDKLSYQSSNLARGPHTVRIEATDASGLKGENTWNFKVVRRH